MSMYIKSLTVGNNTQLHRESLHKITSAYMRTGRERVC